MANDFLTRIPTSTGNQKIFTYSCWIKRNKLSDWMRLLSITNNNTDAIIQLTNADKLRFRDEVTSPDVDYISSRPLRDVGSWMHIVVSVDMTATQGEHRIRMYINGDSLIEHGLDTESMPGDKNLDLQFNDFGLEHRFFARNSNSEYFFGEAFDLFWVDGQALTPDVFGFNKDGDGYVSVGSTQATDFRPGQWVPKSPRTIKSEINRRGGFGVNGFYLPMNDSSNPGADFHTTPNSIITLKGEDLPQPRNGAPTTTDAYVSQLRQEAGILGFDGAVKFDGSGDYLSLADNADFSFDGDFTIEAFVYPTALNTFNTIFSTENLDFKLISSGAVRIYTSSGSNTTGTIPLSRWSHIALVRQSSTFKVYINGNGETVTPPAFTGDGSSAAEIGRKIRNTSEELTGFISNLRVVKGTALYTSNFTAPSEPLTNVNNTKLLCCNSSTSATAATVSPGSITANGNAFATRNELSGSIVLAVPGASLKNDIDLDDTELIDNTGWVDYAGDSATVTVSNGTVTIDNGASNTNGRAISAVFNTTVGQSYKISFKAVSNTGSAGFYTEIRQSNGFGSTQTFNAGTTLGIHEFSFVATETSHTFTLYALATGGSATYSDVSIKETNNLIGNGSFDYNTTSWSNGNPSQFTYTYNSVGGDTSGKIMYYAVDNNLRTFYQYITCVSGKRYTLSFDACSDTANAMVIDIDGTNVVTIDDNNNVGYIHYNVSFTAGSTSVRIRIESQLANRSYFDNFVVKQEDAPRDYSADIKGSGSNKTLTPTGYSGVGYELGGYYGSAINFPYAVGQRISTTSSDFAMGTGDFTVEVWIYPNQVVNYKTIFATRPSNSNHPDGFNMWIDANGKTGMYSNGFLTQTASGTITPNQWTHVVAERYNGQLTTYVNGVAAAVQLSNNQNYTRTVASIGELAVADQEQFDGAMQDLRVYKGVAKYRGGFDVPKPYTPVSIESWRQVPDTCKNNFATWNPLLGPQGCALADGNLTVTSDGANQHKGTRSTMGMSSGKWYWEYRVGTVAVNSYVGVSEYMDPNGLAATNYIVSGQGGNNFVSPNGSFSVTDSSLTTGMIIGCAFDRDASTQQLKVYKNGSLAVTGTCSDLGDGVIYLAHNSFNAAVSDGWEGNFGQNPTFSGTVTAGTYTDSNGKGLFKYQPPAGYLALCEDNLPAPAIADPGKHFKTVLYTGDGNSGRSITGVGFQPDFVWIKRRASGNQAHALHDSVRGPSIHLETSTTDPDETNNVYGALHSFDKDGFSIALGSGGGGDYVNTSGQTYVAWCWKAGGAAVSNTDGTITSQVSANQDAGFSIVSYTGNGTVGATVGHGLGKKPKFFITKNRDTAANWPVFSEELLGSNGYMYLNLTNSAATTSGISGPTSSVLTLSGYSDMNKSGDDMIAYCWAEIEGYSKFGSYQGSGNSDGPFVYCGFKPAWVMIKSSTVATNWYIFDNSRKSTNPITAVLFSNTSDVETDNAHDVDFLSNGFKVRQASGYGGNNSGATYIFVAFAESPFQTANAK